MQVITAGNRLYSQCGGCGQLIQLNKVGIGSLHFCKTPCERAGRHLSVSLSERHRFLFWTWRTYSCGSCGMQEMSRGK